MDTGRPGPHAADRSRHAEGDGQGLGPRRRGQELVHVVLRQHRVARRVAESGGVALRRHRRRAGAGERERRGGVAQGSGVPRRARCDIRERPGGLAARRERRLCRVQQPQDGRLQAVPAAERRPRPDVGVDCLEPARARQRVDARGRSSRSETAVRRHRVRPVLHPRRRRLVGAAQGRHPDDRRARHQDPGPRERPRRRHLRPRHLHPRRLHPAAPVEAGRPRPAIHVVPGEDRAGLHPVGALRHARQGLLRRVVLPRAEPALRRGVHLLHEGRLGDAREEAAGGRARGGEEGRGGALSEPRPIRRRGEGRGAGGRDDGEGRRGQRRAQPCRAGVGRIPPHRVGPAVPALRADVAAARPGQRPVLRAARRANGRARALHGVVRHTCGRCVGARRHAAALRGRGHEQIVAPRGEPGRDGRVQPEDRAAAAGGDGRDRVGRRGAEADRPHQEGPRQHTGRRSEAGLRRPDHRAPAQGPAGSAERRLRNGAAELPDARGHRRSRRRHRVGAVRHNSADCGEQPAGLRDRGRRVLDRAGTAASAR